MRKIFTSVILFVASLLAVTPMKAQTQLTDQQKEAFVKTVVPVLVDQVKQLSGIDIVSLANPTISDVISSPLFGTTSVLRSSTAVDLTLQPDSMTLDLSEVITLDQTSTLGATIGQMLDDIKVTYSDYVDFTLTTTEGRTIAISVPQKMTATMAGSISADLNLSFGAQTGLLPFSTFEASLDLGSLESVVTMLGYDFSEPLLSMSESSSSGVYTYSVSVNSTLMGLIDEDLASMTDYTIQIDMSKIQTTGVIGASLYAIYSSNVTLPVGDVDVYMNLTSLASGSYAADSLIITNYTLGTASPSDYQKIVRYTEGSGTTIKRHNVSYTKSTEENATWTWSSHTMNTFNGNYDIDDSNIVVSIIQGVMADLTYGNADSFNLTTTTFSNESDTTGTKTTKVTVTPSMVGTQAGKIVTSIMTYDSDTQSYVDKLDITMNIPTTSETISIDFDAAAYESTVATIYVKSNAMSIITDTETVASEVEEVKVSTNASGLYVRNGEGSYIVVNMVGRVVSTGIITSNEQQINLNVPTGIYMISISQTNGKRTTVKFVK